MPAIAREYIERKLLETNFSHYKELAEHLKSLGKGVSKSGLHRHGAEMQARIARAKFEAEVMEQMSDDAAFLLRWARAYPADARRMVKRLRKKQQQQA